MKYSAKEDIIKIYADRRKALVYEDVKDLLDAFTEYVNKELATPNDLGEFAYVADGFGEFFEPEFDPRDLIKRTDRKTQQKAEAMLHEWVITGLPKPKKIKIFDDEVHRT